MPAFGPETVQSVERSIALEWLETNGLGDFACGTVAGPATRRHHGLFTAAPPPGGNRMLLPAALDVTLAREEERFELSCHQYVRTRHPEGFRRCVSFLNDPFPEWRYEVPGTALTARVFMPRHRRCTIFTWTLDAASGPGPWRLHVRPLFACRESDSLTHANDAVDMSFRREGSRLAFRPYAGCPEVFLHCGRAEVKPASDWYYRFQHPWDIALGRDGEEDLFSPCELTFRIAPGQCVSLAAGIEPEVSDPVGLETEERARRLAISLPGMEDDSTAHALARAAEAFLVRDPGNETQIVAAYPEPAADLRATLTALPGLLLSTRRLSEARDILAAAVKRVLESAVPESLDDVPLRLICAGDQYVGHSQDWDFLRDELAPACETLIERYIANKSDTGFRLAPDALLFSEQTSRPLSWMDARIDGWPVTPRAGKPVEVNALWHHALSLLTRWSRRRGNDGNVQRFGHLRDLCSRSFRHRFWNAAEGCLYDVIDPPENSGGEASSRAFRPNQVLAVSLPSDLLDRRQAAGVLSFVEKRLLTPYGLRTLSLEDRAFQPRYAGGPIERAGARHQGSVFPWLMGAYVDAIFRVHGRTSRAYARAEAALEPLLREHLQQACVGHVSELFCGAAPHAACGAFSHAPAVAELLRAYVEIRATGW